MGGTWREGMGTGWWVEAVTAGWTAQVGMGAVCRVEGTMEEVERAAAGMARAGATVVVEGSVAVVRVEVAAAARAAQAVCRAGVGVEERAPEAVGLAAGATPVVGEMEVGSEVVRVQGVWGLEEEEEMVREGRGSAVAR